MLAVMRLGTDAYGMTVRREIEARTGREISIGAVYATLERLEATSAPLPTAGPLYVVFSRTNSEMIKGDFMKHPLLITAATLFALALAHTGSAQGAQGRGGPPAAPTITTLAGDVQADWAIQKEWLVNAADAMPDDKFGYKPTPAPVVLKKFTDQQLNERVTTPSSSFMGPSASRLRLVYASIWHSMDIYGQMAVYLRLNGIVPPASRRGGI
jgi:hypothetical protein